MSSILPIGMEALLSGAVETARLELKASWDEKTTGPQVLKTLCAFANDLQNLNGGYVVIGVAERNGVALRPARGLSAEEIDAAQKWIRGNCNRIEPTYMPVMDAVPLDGKLVLVLWAPASDVRPHQAPDGNERKYFVRIGSESVAARDAILTRLMQQTARVPFDDRRAFGARIEDLRESKVREFLRDVRSDLVDEPDAAQVYRRMLLTQRVNGHEEPRNVALLFFTDDPQVWFRGARIEAVQFADDAGGNTIEERVFRGPVHEQVRECLAFLGALAPRHLEKSAQFVTRGWIGYPTPALREAVVNAVYHRSYDAVVEPTKVYLYPDRVEVISYPGPVDGIEPEHLSGERLVPPVPARNRRIGELLKELGLAEARGTGIPKIFRAMRENGSPAPRFEFDAARTYFRVTLPAHPEYVALMALRDAAYLETTGDELGALRRLEDAWRASPASAPLAAALVRVLARRGDLARAKAVLESTSWTPGLASSLVLLARVLLSKNRQSEAREVLDRLPGALGTDDALDAALLESRVQRPLNAHRHFLQAGDRVSRDVWVLHEFAQVKLELAKKLGRKRRLAHGEAETRRRLLEEAEALLTRVVQLDATEELHGLAWYELGLARDWLGRPESEVVSALEQAVRLCPGERKFTRELRKHRPAGGQG